MLAEVMAELLCQISMKKSRIICHIFGRCSLRKDAEQPG